MDAYAAVGRVYNFSAGPAVLPLPVLEQAQREMLALPGCGISVLEISHRSKPFEAILMDAQARLKALLQVPDNYRILFLQGGARLQFSMIPMNLARGTGKPADYILTGSWGKNAMKEAKRECEVRVAWDGQATNYDHLPTPAELQLSPDAAMVHMTSNETIQGVQFTTPPDVGNAPLVCDASSDFLSRPVSIDRFGVIYACAQKNVGPAGVTVVVIREDLLERSQDTLPGYLNFSIHAAENSLWNTPPSFAVYIVGLVAKWLQEEIGGLAKMQDLNHQKAALLYQAIDGSQGFYRGHSRPECRSMMNVTFRLATPELEADFLAEAAEQGLVSLKGHRSVGGVRASIYNAMPLAGVEKLRDHMLAFAQRRA
ncbi:MAG: 3-phosphoserine/phosphohydroxythreonine transaminase [Planctomycetaceae bacterium]|nr:3-phosphoserine/phosphohydroxythreonine transaminase [Planctomycetaceae bacterium]